MLYWGRSVQGKDAPWFQAGPEGAIVSEFSMRSFDKENSFTDPEIARRSNLQ